MQVDLSKYNNCWYKTRAHISIRLAWYFVNVLFFINPLNLSSKLKVLLLRMFGARVGKGVIIKPSVNIKYPWNLTIGDYSWIGENVWIDNLVQISIGSNVCISQGAMLLCGNHNYKLCSFDLIVKTIKIEDGAWIGAKSIVCPGVVVGSHSVLAVGSVSSKNLDPYYIYKGNPAVKIAKREII